MERALPMRDVASFDVVLDLIGDLDASLAALAAETLARLLVDGTREVLVTTKHVALSSNDGIAALDEALLTARKAGIAIGLESGRRMRSAFARAGVATSSTTRHYGRARHVMIAHRSAAASGKGGTKLPLSA